jgi:hypothetical protein
MRTNDTRFSSAERLLLGLEYLVAADIIRTVALEPTMTNAAILGVLVVVRTFLSWSLVVEIEGRWPWAARNDVEAVRTIDADPGRARHGARRGPVCAPWR